MAEIEDGLRAEARERILVGVATKDMPGGIELIGQILMKHPEEAHPQTWVALGAPRKGRAREIARWIEEPGLRAKAIRTLRVHCDARMVERQDIADRQEELIALYREAALERPAEAVELLRVFACLPKGAIDDVLRDALNLEDVEMALAAAESLMAHRVKVPPAALERLAAADETRARLFDATRGRKFPAGWKTQEALARSVMVEHVGAVDEIELVEMVAVDVGGETGVLDHYVFRFRRDGGSWRHGIAGPFRHEDAPTTEDHGGTHEGKRVDAKAVIAEYGEPGAVDAGVKTREPAKTKTKAKKKKKKRRRR
jgi:hypothetical protein